MNSKAIDKKRDIYRAAQKQKTMKKGHVAGAKKYRHVKNIDKDFSSIIASRQNAPVYTYCYSGNRSSKAAQKAVELGYTNVYEGF